MSSQAGAAATLRTLLGIGVRRFVLCPGSRSAPLAYALRELEILGAISLHVETDERSGGFVALGLSKASGEPTVIVTTSGTAVANLHPALAEAYHSGIPLIAVTADRPARMRGSGANQTTDQVGLLGPGLVGEIDISAEDVADRPHLLDSVLDAVRCGPIHINLSFEDPLTPDGPSFTTAPDASIFTVPADEVEPEWLDDRPTVIVAGPGAPFDELLGRSGDPGVPILAEPATPQRNLSRAIPAARVVTEHFSPEIERVIIVGHPTLSRPMTRLMSRSDIEVLSVRTEPVPTDPGRVARVLDVMPRIAGQDEWLARWQRAGAAAHRAGRLALGDGLDALTAGAAIADAGAEWFLGASNIIRDVDLLAGYPNARFHSSRGLAGIDGSISTARGMAHMIRGMKAAVGDLTFIHDLGGLVLTRGQDEPPLDIVVIDDSGGGIFATLEHGEKRYERYFDRVFRTAKKIDIVAAADALGWTGINVGSVNELKNALGQPAAGRVIRVACERPVDEVRRRRKHVARAMAAAVRDAASGDSRLRPDSL
ncbi:2-succinyl-5-enolpyruvyl-6-hydroxy-3-cyclohexene-1-carboxylic-acid synthase [Flaviflexus huanghaiensis]|uniref:2-succinyl-5-enolpyruvyl-6-hydroxy-3- cyclohexene-1-carboxylic-acid synthase n=1 Tax=Flaviflexus huanghaiensis TaxID=1111473 RepID=UPI0015FBBD02